MSANITEAGRIFTCACGRTFEAKTDSRIGLTRSNANRHAAKCAAAPVAPSVSEQMEAALNRAKEQREAGRELEVTTKRGCARQITVTTKCLVSTDGRFVAEKDGSDDKKPWTLFMVTENKPLAVGHFRTGDAAFGADGVLAHNA